MTRRSAILANILLSLPMAGGLLGAAPSASAQNNQLVATIPFAFTVGDHHLAAGSYSVERVSNYALAVRNNKTNHGVFLAVRGEDGRGIASRGRLVFERAGGGMYLTEAWFAGTDKQLDAVSKPQRDRDYAKQNSPATRVIEVASK
jgi:hypothetical protein